MRAPVSESHRDNQLQSIRNEMNALLGILSRPISLSASAPSQPAPTGIAKVKTMRPRLVLEPRPIPVAVEPPRLRLEQRDLFGEFGGELEPAE